MKKLCISCLWIIILFPGFLFARQGVFVFVNNGERMVDFETRLISRGLLTEDSLLLVAAEGDFSEYPHVPDPVNSISRFEGLFIPGEYFFPDDFLISVNVATKPQWAGKDNALRIVTLLLHHSAPRYRNWNPVMGLTLRESIILTSIVEKEAVSNRHYSLVASVFYNRLDSGARLSSCPSVEYALGYHRPFLSYDDIKIESPYNLYIHRGLPPTPICFFSDDAIEGTLYAPVTDLFYFVFDWTTGELYFTGNYETHIENSDFARANYTRLHGNQGRFRIYEDKFYEF